MILPLTLTEDNFVETIKEGYVVIDFWADWCAPCHMLSKTLSIVEEEIHELTVAQCNIEDNADIAAAFGVKSLPTMLIFSNGRPLERISGSHPKEIVKGWIQRQMNEK